MTTPVPSPQTPTPLRTWRPMAAWTAGILVALGLTWFGASIYSDVRQVNEALPWFDWYCHGANEKFDTEKGGAEECIHLLGGPRIAVRKLTLYCRLPNKLAGSKPLAIRLMGHCGTPAVPFLNTMQGSDEPIRSAAASALKKIRGEENGKEAGPPPLRQPGGRGESGAEQQLP